MEAGRKLVLAARDGKLRDCKELLKLLPTIDFTEPPLCRTAFWHAAWKGHEAVCRLLLEKGADINHQDFEGRTALHEAAYHGHAHIVRFLLENNASIDLADAAGETALMRAVRGRRAEVVECLLTGGAATNLVTPDEVTAFHLAAFEGTPQLAKYLFYRGAYRNRFSLQDRIEAERSRLNLAEQQPVSAPDLSSEGELQVEPADEASIVDRKQSDSNEFPSDESDHEMCGDGVGVDQQDAVRNSSSFTDDESDSASHQGEGQRSPVSLPYDCDGPEKQESLRSSTANEIQEELEPAQKHTPPDGPSEVECADVGSATSVVAPDGGTQGTETLAA